MLLRCLFGRFLFAVVVLTPSFAHANTDSPQLPPGWCESVLTWRGLEKAPGQYKKEIDGLRHQIGGLKNVVVHFQDPNGRSLGLDSVSNQILEGSGHPAFHLPVMVPDTYLHVVLTRHVAGQEKLNVEANAYHLRREHILTPASKKAPETPVLSVVMEDLVHRSPSKLEVLSLYLALTVSPWTQVLRVSVPVFKNERPELFDMIFDRFNLPDRTAQDFLNEIKLPGFQMLRAIFPFDVLSVNATPLNDDSEFAPAEATHVLLDLEFLIPTPLEQMSLPYVSER